MKRFRAPYIFITFKTSVNCEAIAVSDGMESLSFLITGLAQKYDLLNDKPIGGYNYFIPNPYEYQDGYAVSTNIPGISPESGKCEAVLFGVVKKTVDNNILTYFVYAKKDITEEILNCEDDSIQLSLFQDTMTLQQDAVPSVYGKDMVWNELK